MRGFSLIKKTYLHGLIGGKAQNTDGSSVQGIIIQYHSSEAWALRSQLRVIFLVSTIAYPEMEWQKSLFNIFVSGTSKIAASSWAAKAFFRLIRCGDERDDVSNAGVSESRG